MASIEAGREPEARKLHWARVSRPGAREHLGARDSGQLGHQGEAGATRLGHHTQASSSRLPRGLKYLVNTEERKYDTLM